MPQLSAASSRDRPSKTSAIASIRRAALASRVRAAARRKSPADRSRRVIATAMSASAPGQWRSESRRRPKRGHVRVIGQGAWYYTLDLTASDGGANITALSATVTVSNVDETPVNATTGAFAAAEGQAPGTVVGTVRATDPEGQPVSYAIASGNDDGAFAIDNGTGIVTSTANFGSGDAPSR